MLSRLSSARSLLSYVVVHYGMPKRKKPKRKNLTKTGVLNQENIFQTRKIIFPIQDFFTLQQEFLSMSKTFRIHVENENLYARIKTYIITQKTRIISKFG